MLILKTKKSLLPPRAIIYTSTTVIDANKVYTLYTLSPKKKRKGNGTITEAETAYFIDS
jgi:hypothetical protein